MKKTARNNKREFLKTNSELQHRYGFRKLASGMLVSAALGAFFMMNSSLEVKADVVEDKQLQTNEITDGDTVKNNISEASDEVTIDEHSNNYGNSLVENELESSENQDNSQLTEPTSTQSLQSRSQPVATTRAVSAQAAESQDRGKLVLGSNSTVGNTQGADNNIKLVLQAHGDNSYQISIPINNDVYEIKPANISANEGTLTSRIENGYLVLTYEIIKNGVLNVPINLITKNNYQARPTPMGDIGTTQHQINWQINGIQQSPLDFTQIINPDLNPEQPVRIKPNADTVKGVQVGKDVTYVFNVNETPGIQNTVKYESKQINSAVNYGTTITIPVPEGFVLDEKATMDSNAFQDQTTITQPGGKGSNIIINVPKGSGSQNWQGKSGYKLIGRYEMDQPEKDTLVSAKGDIVIDQKLGDGEDAKHLVKTVASISETLIGKDTLLPIGELGTGAAGAYENKLIFSTSEDIIVGYFGIINNSVYDFDKDATITLNFADGLDVNKVKTPASATKLPGTSSYSYVATLVDGTTIKGTVAAGESVTSDQGFIRSIVFTPNLIATGAETESLPSNWISRPQAEPAAFIAYGKLGKQYQDGSQVSKDDKLTSSISFTGAGITSTSSVTQTVIEATDLPASLDVFQYQTNNVAGTNNAGYLSLYSGDQANALTTNVYEPIFYYVLPNGTTTSMPLTLNDLNANGEVSAKPKLSTFVVDGRTVVKVDYTGTDYTFNTNQGANNQLTLNNNPDTVNGNYPWDIYMISPKTKLTNPLYTDNTQNNFSTNPTKNPFNIDWVEGNTDNLYHVGGGNWLISQVSSLSSQTMMQGNQDPNLTTNATSDDKGSPDMKISISLINGENTKASNINAYVELPSTNNGSGFNFELTGPIEFDGNATVYYSTEFMNFGEDEPSADSFVLADQVKDWSKIRTIKVSTSELDANEVLGRLIINGQDKTIAEDAGKVGYVDTAFYSQNHLPYFKKAQSEIKVIGSSKVTSQLTYSDSSGKTHVVDIPELSYSFNDNKDKFLTEQEARQNFEEKAKDLIPEGYELKSIELIAPEEKSWESDAPMGTPEFGELVRYYYNNAVIQYNLVGKDISTQESKTVTRKIITTLPDGKQTIETQEVTLTRTKTTNAQTGVTSYTEWSSGEFESKTPESFDNYTTLVDGKPSDLVQSAPVQIKDDEPINGEDVYVTYEAKMEEVSESKTITRTIIDHLPGKDAVITKQEVTFTRKGIKNQATGETNWDEWTSDNDKWDEYQAIGAEGYTPSQKTVSDKKVSVNDQDEIIEITYTKDPVTPVEPDEPINPEDPDPTDPDNPEPEPQPKPKPEDPVTPENGNKEEKPSSNKEQVKSNDISNPKPIQTVENTVQVTEAKKQDNQQNNFLPQAGAKASSVILLGISSLLIVLGLGGLVNRRKKNKG